MSKSEQLSQYNQEFSQIQKATTKDNKDDFTNCRVFKIIVVGDTNVGKTCLTYRFCEGKFPEKTEATIGVDFREKNVVIKRDVLKVSFKTSEIFPLKSL